MPEFQVDAAVRGGEFSVDAITAQYLGRADFAEGSIESTATQQEFMEMLTIVKNNLLYVANYEDEFTGCMDGRNNAVDELGNPFDPRIKVKGGSSVFAYNVAAYGQFEIVEGIERPLDQFTVVNQRLVDSKLRLGMHYECGAARGAGGVAENYHDNYKNIHSLSGQDAKRSLAEDNHKRESMLRQGALLTAEAITKYGDDFTEENMHSVVRALNGPEAIVHLEVDHDHPNHGHTEQGLALLRVSHAKIDKPAVIAAGADLFYHNVEYAKRIVRALASNPEEIVRGDILADTLAIAGIATLGTRQHVGELTGELILAA